VGSTQTSGGEGRSLYSLEQQIVGQVTDVAEVVAVGVGLLLDV
jgi:hypothetical protein